MSTGSVPERVTRAHGSEREGAAATEPVLQGARVLLYVDRLPSIPTLHEALADLGVEVRVATSFQELSALLLCWRDRTALLLQPPAMGTFRRAVLELIRRLAPTIPIVAIVPSLTAEIEQDLANERVTSVITANGAPQQITSELMRALRLGTQPGFSEDPPSEGDAP